MREEKFQNIYEDMTVMRTNPMPNLSPTPNFSFGFLSGAAAAASSPDLLQSPPSSNSGDPSVSEERGESGTGDPSTILQRGFPPPPDNQKQENKK